MTRLSKQWKCQRSVKCKLPCRGCPHTGISDKAFRLDEMKAQAMLEGYLLALDRINEDFRQIHEATPAPETRAAMIVVDKPVAERKRMISEYPNGMSQ